MASNDSMTNAPPPEEKQEGKTSSAVQELPVEVAGNGALIGPQKAAMVSGVWKEVLAHAENIPGPKDIGRSGPVQPTPVKKQAMGSFRFPDIPPHIEQAGTETATAAPMQPAKQRLAPGMPGYAPERARINSVGTMPQGAAPQQPAAKRIRTYKSDVAMLMRGEKTSLVDIALAGAQKKRTETEHHADTNSAHAALLARPDTTSTPGRGKRLLIIGIGFLLLCAGAAALVGAFVFLTKKEPTMVNNITVTPLVFSDNAREIDLTRANRQTTITALNQEVARVALSLGALEHLYITEGLGTDKKIIPTTRLFEVLRASPGASLVRSLQPTFMFGAHVFDGNQPFLIFKSTFFENTFAGMLAWEPDMLLDLGPIFIDTKETSTTSAQSLRAAAARGFEDAVVQNKDARVVRDIRGNIIFLYTFPDRETLVLTTNEQTLKELLYRMTTLRFVP